MVINDDYQIWLFNSLPWKIINPAFKFAKPSISMGHQNPMAMLVITRLVMMIFMDDSLPFASSNLGHPVTHFPANHTNDARLG